MTDWCIHIANIFYLMSFIGRDILWLRILTCCGLVFGVIFFSTCQPSPMYGPMFWHLAFLVINLYQIHHLVHERRRLRLTRSEQAISRGMLAGLSDEELADSLAHALLTDKEEVELVTRDAQLQLSRQEAALRDIAFSRLSRAELINLLSRRIWRSLKRMRPQWTWRTRSRETELPTSSSA